MTRIKPPRCADCGREPWRCPSCGDYQCGCLNPYIIVQDARRQNKTKIIPRVHYNKAGKPYPQQYIDGFTYIELPDEEEDIQWLIEGGIKP